MESMSQVWLVYLSFLDGPFPSGKVYCNLCGKSIAANSSSLKQHCVGYNSGKAEEKKWCESDHSKKVKKRQEREEQSNARAPVAEQSLPTTFVAQVCDCG